MRIILLGAVLFLALGCSSTKNSSPENYSKRQIIFGNGGGFTGKVDTYILLDNGQLYNQVALTGSNYQQLPSLDPEITKQIFENYDRLQLNKKMLNDPGNLTYFVKMKQKEDEHKLTWGGAQQKLDPNVNRFYMNLFQLAQRQKKTPQKR